MIINFNKFNESKIEQLKSSVENAFVYISDDNVVEIDEKQSEIVVLIKTTLPSSIIYNDINEYTDKHSKWNETLLDINVIIKQLEISKDIISISSINTVGNIKIRFFIKNDKILVSDNNNIIISTLNLDKAIFDIIKVNIKTIKCDNDYKYAGHSTNSIVLYFSDDIDIDILSRGITKILMNILPISENMIDVKYYNYNRDCVSITINVNRDNNSNRLKVIKLQYTV